MKTITLTQTYCNPCKPISQIKRLEAGDMFRVKSAGAGYPEGKIIPLYGYSRTKEAGLCILTQGTMPRGIRDCKIYPDGEVKEVLFKILPLTIAEIPLQTAEEYLEYIPAKQAKLIQLVPEVDEFQTSYSQLKVA